VPARVWFLRRDGGKRSHHLHIAHITTALGRGSVTGDGTQTSPQGQLIEPMTQISRTKALVPAPNCVVRAPGDLHPSF
jgi:hypothetical protein